VTGNADIVRKARATGNTSDEMRTQLNDLEQPLNELADGMQDLLVIVQLHKEVVQHPSERRRLRAQLRTRMDDSIGSTAPHPVPASRLELLLLVAGRRTAVTPADLEDQFGGGRWAESLAVLAELGAVAGDPTNGYRADKDLTALWWSADPRLRHAIRSNAAMLVDGDELAALTVSRVEPVVDRDAEKAALKALNELLSDADEAFRHWRDGWVDDAGIAWRRLAGMVYQLRHPAGRRDWPAYDRAAPIRFARTVGAWAAASVRREWVPTKHRFRLWVLSLEVDAARRRYFRVWQATDFRAYQQLEGGLPEDAVTLLHAAIADLVEAHAGLAEARREAIEEMQEVGAYPHQRDRTLHTANQVLRHSPESDPLPPPVLDALKAITSDLRAITRRLDAMKESDPKWEETLEEARWLLERHRALHGAAWHVALWRDYLGWKAAMAAERAAHELRGRHKAVNAPRDPGTSETAARMAAVSRPGVGRPLNQDHFALVSLPNGDRVEIVIDGLWSYPGSNEAAHRFAGAFAAEIRRVGGRSAEEALRAAHDVAQRAMTSRYEPANGHSGVTYVASYIPVDGPTWVSHVGSARAYFLAIDENGVNTALTLTADHSRGGVVTEGGIMDRFAASNYRPEPTIRPFPRVAGLLVLITDGVWRYLRTADEVAALLAPEDYGDPDTVARKVDAAVRGKGGRDDYTVAIAAVMPGSAGPRGIGGGGFAALDTLRDADRLTVLASLPGLADQMIPLEGMPHRMPRGPPGVRVVVVDGELPVPGVIAFGWAERRVVVITRRMLDEIAAHLAAGRLAADWWYGLLAHERDFHLHGAEHTGDRHDAHAAGFADMLRAARAQRDRDQRRVTQPERDSWADQLAAIPLRLPAGGDSLAPVLRRWVADAMALLRGQGWDPAWPRPPPVVFHLRESGLARSAGSPHHGDGETLHVVADQPVEALMGLVEELFAGWAGMGPQQTRVVAVLTGEVLAGRISDRTGQPGERYRELRSRLEEIFADWKRWRELAVALVEHVDASAVVPRAGEAIGLDRSGWSRTGRPRWLPGWSTGLFAGRRAPGTKPVAVDPSNRFVELATPRPNLKLELYPAEVARAARYGVTRARLSNHDEVAAIVRFQPVVKGVLARDGSVWIIPAGLPHAPGTPLEDVVEFSHAFAAAGRDVQLAFMAVLRLDGERITAEVVTAESGHYNYGNTVQQNWRIVYAVRLAMRAHGITTNADPINPANPGA
jgi:hypothetical protein